MNSPSTVEEFRSTRTVVPRPDGTKIIFYADSQEANEDEWIYIIRNSDGKYMMNIENHGYENNSLEILEETLWEWFKDS